MSDANFLAVVAQQRAGTTAFRRCLVDTGLFLDFQEIFHSDLRGCSGNFWDFVLEKASRAALLAFPTRENIEQLFEDYLRHLRHLLDESGRPFAMFDVKLNSSHALNEIWHPPGARANIFNLLSARNLAVLHIERTNILAQAISERVANETGIWHLDSDQGSQVNSKVAIGPGSVLKRVLELDEGAELLRSSVRGIERCATLQYEALFDEGTLSAGARQSIISLTGALLPANCEVALKKVVPSPGEVISNWGEIVEFFGTTKYRDLAIQTFR